MKIELSRSFVALGLGLSMAILVMGITGCADDQQSATIKHSPTYVKPTWSGDDHTPPVYTSPTITPATTNLPAGNTPP